MKMMKLHRTKIQIISMSLNFTQFTRAGSRFPRLYLMFKLIQRRYILKMIWDCVPY